MRVTLEWSSRAWILAAFAVSLWAPACGSSRSQWGDSKGGGASGGGGTPNPAGATGGAKASGGATASGGSGGAVTGAPQPVSPYIVVDQFGYLTDAEKLAVLRDPEVGLDAAESFTPGSAYALVNVATSEQTALDAPRAWNGGATDPSSGDRTWRVEFSSVVESGEYYLLDVDNQVRSHVFRIGEDVYRSVLKQAVRMLYYQRAGQEKLPEHAGAGWADEASHVGPQQDHEARLFSDKANAATERDLWGGWYDAGDLNKYTSWTAGYVENLLRAYVQKPEVWSDDYEIPESGNGIPDVLDEAKWGMDFLTRMQNTDGSLLSIVGEASASPPSAAKGPSYYGSANTSATLAGAAAFAYGARVFGEQEDPGLKSYAEDLLARAERAWAWASANPSVLFRNNDAASNSSGLGAGQQEVNDYGRSALKLDAACQLFAATGAAAYRDYFDANYKKSHLFAYNNYAAPWDVPEQEAQLEYSQLSGATASVAQAIRTAYLAGAASDGNLGAIQGDKDPYLAYLKDYVWGSNSTKSNQGNVLFAVSTYDLDAARAEEFERAAARYVHYLHGVNPLSLVYLSNMSEHGAENSVNEIYHSWFVDNSARWDRVGTSTFGPAPAFLSGGPNPGYDWDACCPGSCGSSANNMKCGAMALSPPKGQPAQKSYKDFNAEWPLNSWSVTEPSNGYQIAYIRLLSKFVR